MKDSLLYKRCSKLEKENQEKDKEIKRLSEEIDIWKKKYNEVFNELKKVRNNG